MVNSGQARVGSLLLSAAYLPWRGVKLSSELTLNASRVSSTGSAFPYLPATLATLGVEYVAQTQIWSIGGSFRAASSAVVTSDFDRVPGYGELNLTGRYRLFRIPMASADRATYLSATLQNVFGRPIEFIQDYPTEGRVYVLALQADI
jgi:hypothetical protein